MPYTLHLLRHAQSAEKQPGQHDIDRELTSRGMKEAATIGHYLKKNKIGVDLIVSSKAKRAQATAALVHGILNISEEILIEEELYQASVRNFLEICRQQEEVFKNILLVGHNPYISYFAEYLTKAEIGSMEPAGIASIRFEISKWSEVTEGGGSLEIYTHPSILD